MSRSGGRRGGPPGHHGGPGRSAPPPPPGSSRGNQSSGAHSQPNYRPEDVGFWKGLCLAVFHGFNVFNPKPKDQARQTSLNYAPYNGPEQPSTIRQSAFMNVAVMLSIILGCCMIIANILGIKVWTFGPIIIDGGTVIFPITYVIGDVLVLRFRKEISDIATNITCCVAIFVSILFLLCDLIPDPTNIHNPSMHDAFDFSIRVNLASVTAFYVSRHINNSILMKRLKAGKSKFWSAFLSSVFAHIWDSMLFTYLGFWGRKYGFLTLTQQAFTSLLIAISIEFLLNQPKFWICSGIDKYLDYVERTQNDEPVAWYKKAFTAVKGRFHDWFCDD